MVETHPLGFPGQVAEMHRQVRENSDLVPYIGPGRLLERFIAGEIVTGPEVVADESKWVARAIHGAQRRRLDYMLTRA